MRSPARRSWRATCPRSCTTSPRRGSARRCARPAARATGATTAAASRASRRGSSAARSPPCTGCRSTSVEEPPPGVDRMWALSLPEPPHELLLGPERRQPRSSWLASRRARALCARLRRAAASTSPTTALVHGDLRWENCLALAAPGSRRRTRVLLVDWELAGAGARGLRRRHRAGRVPARVGRVDPDRRPPRSRRLVGPRRVIRWSACGRRCRPSGRPTASRAPGRRRSRRVVELAAVRLLQTAVERAQGLARASAHVVTLVQLADNMLRAARGRGAGAAGAARVSRLPRSGRGGARGRDDPRPDPVRLARPRAAGRSRRRSTPSSTSAERRRYLVACLREELYCVVLLPRRARCRRAGASRSRVGRRPAAGRRRMSQANARPRELGARLDGRARRRRRRRSSLRSPACARPGRRLPTLAGAVRPGARRQRPAAEGAAGAVAGLLHGRSATRPGTSTSAAERGARVLERHAGRRARARAARSPRDSTRTRVPFRLKVADHPFRLDRCDAAVLYLPGESSARCAESSAALAARADAPTCGRGSRRSRSSSRPASGWRRTPAAVRASATGAARCSRMRSCARTSTDRSGSRRASTRWRRASPRTGVQIDAPYLEPSLAGRHVL